MLCRKDLQKSLQTKERTHLVMLVLLERDNFCLDLVFSLSIYAVVCSNVVVHNSDHNEVMVAIVDYYTCRDHTRLLLKCPGLFLISNVTSI